MQIWIFITRCLHFVSAAFEIWTMFMASAA